MKANKIKSLMLQKFGKKASSKWYKAMLDLLMVDCGIKDILLFDCWSVSSCEMNGFLLTAKEMEILSSDLSAFSFGMDVFLYNKVAVRKQKRYSSESSDFKQHVIDISKCLQHPKLLTLKAEDIKETLCVFRSSVDSMISEQKLLHDVEDGLDKNAKINPPCLFGLLLGYPAVYWYDRTLSEDNCLLSEYLYLYQVIGEVKSEVIHLDEGENSKRSLPNHLNSSSGRHENTCHTVLSFSVPVIINNIIKKDIKCWFAEWKKSVPWSTVFAQIWMEEKVVEPQAVCL